MFVKPRLYGIRFMIGSCPPSNPIRTPGPDRAFWPLWPLPAVFPFPEPIPRPIRFLRVLEPSLGFKSVRLSGIPGLLSLTFVSASKPRGLGAQFFHGHEVLHLIDQTSGGVTIPNDDTLVDLPEPKGLNGRRLVFRPSYQASDQGDFHPTSFGRCGSSSPYLALTLDCSRAGGCAHFLVHGRRYRRIDIGCAPDQTHLATSAEQWLPQAREPQAPPSSPVRH